MRPQRSSYIAVCRKVWNLLANKVLTTLNAARCGTLWGFIVFFKIFLKKVALQNCLQQVVYSSTVLS